MDLSDLFKRHFERLNCGHKVVDPVKLTGNRRETQMVQRKNKRTDLLTARRHIKADMSPCITPLVAETPAERASKRNLDPTWATSTPHVCPKNASQTLRQTPQPQQPVSEVVQRRLDRLAQWKAEKEKKKQIAKEKEKPLFKVCHVSDSMPVTDYVNAFIKGKSILTSAIRKRQFAPENGKFNPPAGVKPNPQFQYKRHLEKSASNVSGTHSLTNNHSKIKSTTGPSTSRLTTIKTSQVEKETPKPTTLLKLANSKPVSSAGGRSKLRPTALRTIVPRPNPHDSKKTPVTSKPAESRLEVAQRNQIVTRSKIAKTLSSSSNGSAISLSSSSTSSSTIRPILSKARTKAEENSKEKNNNKRKEIPLAKRKADASEKEANKNTRDTTDKTSDSKKKSRIDKKVAQISQTDGVRSTLSDKKKLNSNKSSRKAKIGGSADAIKTPEPKENNLSIKKSDTPIKTPNNLKSEVGDFPVYVSPFVTISRGKREAREEYKIRRSVGPESETLVNNSIKRKSTRAVSPKDPKFFTAYTSPKAGADYFMAQLNKEIDRINRMCARWQACLEDPELPEEATCSINVTVGHSRLLISKKFKQFRQLIVQCKTQQYEEKEITCEDLHGFWDMIYMQVVDLDKRFANLERMRENNWEEIVPQKEAPVRRAKTAARGAAKKTVASSKLKDMIKAARAKKTALMNGVTCEEDALVETRTPLKEQQVQQVPTTASAKRTSLRVSALTTGTQTKGSSPGLTMMKLTQSIKKNNGLTPFKGILKVDGCKSTGKKSVVFKDFSSPNKLRKTRLLFEDARNTSESPCEDIAEVVVVEGKSARRSLGFRDEEKENTPTCRRSERVRTRRSLSVC